MAKKTGFRDRLKEMRDALGYRTWDQMAAALRDTVGVRTGENAFSAWKAKRPSPEMIAALSLLHPRDPLACLGWLTKGGDMPRIHVDLDDSLPNGARTLYEIGSAAAAISEASRELARGSTQSAEDVLRRVIRPVNIPEA